MLHGQECLNVWVNYLYGELFVWVRELFECLVKYLYEEDESEFCFVDTLFLCVYSFYMLNYQYADELILLTQDESDVEESDDEDDEIVWVKVSKEEETNCYSWYNARYVLL